MGLFKFFNRNNSTTILENSNISVKKKVAIIGTAGVPSRYGGFETLAHQLVNNLNDKHSLSVYCSGKLYKRQERTKYWNNARLFFIPLNANGFQSIVYDIISILHALFYADVLLVLGVSGGILFPFIKRFTNKKIIVNIDGLEWKRPKWSNIIRKYLKLSERLAVKYSDADITDNMAIKEYTAKNYQSLSILIEYGADHVKFTKYTDQDNYKYSFCQGQYAFKVCRIEPENNVSMILSAFKYYKNLPLVMVGNWENSQYGIDLRKEYQKYNHIHLLDPIYDQDELDKLRSNASVYIHGHSAGGTNPSLVEAMYLGLPVIAYDVSYNKATTENMAIYFRSTKNLVEILKTLTKAVLQENKLKMKRIANDRYTWNSIAGKYHRLFLSFDYAYERKHVSGTMQQIKPAFLYKNGLSHLNKRKMFYE